MMGICFEREYDPIAIKCGISILPPHESITMKRAHQFLVETEKNLK